MTIILPPAARTTDYALRRVTGSEPQRSAVGGVLTPLNRAGDHWAVEVDPGVLCTAAGRELLADIVRGGGERLRAPIPEPGVAKGTPGAPKVKGAGQAGSLLVCDGFTPQYAIAKGWFFTLVTAAGSSAHLVTAQAVADGSGEATLSFWPMLWRAPADNDVLVFVDPYIEGLIVEAGDQTSGLLAAVETDAFLIEEG